MKSKYFSKNFNIIFPEEYAKNITTYQFEKAIFMSHNDLLKEVQKDFWKDFYSYLIENDINVENRESCVGSHRNI